MGRSLGRTADILPATWACGGTADAEVLKTSSFVGSTPTRPIAGSALRIVLDVSTLQALHRAGVLDAVRQLSPEGMLLPASVAAHTREAYAEFGNGKAPDLDALAWISVEAVSPEELRAHEAAPPGKSRRRSEAISEKRPLCHGYAVDREEFEVVVLALRSSAVAVLDDHAGLRCADNLHVPTKTTRELLEVMKAAGLVADTVEGAIAKIEATGYVPTKRRSKRAEPRPPLM